MLDEIKELCKSIDTRNRQNRMQENRINELKIKLKNAESMLKKIENITDENS